MRLTDRNDGQNDQLIDRSLIANQRKQTMQIFDESLNEPIKRNFRKNSAVEEDEEQLVGQSSLMNSKPWINNYLGERNNTKR